MSQWFERQTRHLSFSSSFVIGLLFGIGILIGSLLTQSNAPSQSVQIPEQLLHATATHGGESFAMATGSIVEGMEGVFFLDFLTADLRCQVIDTGSGKLGGVFFHNVAADLRVEHTKKQSFLICTGVAKPRKIPEAKAQLAETLLFIADPNSGNWAAYALLWNDALAKPDPNPGKLLLIGTGKARNLIRD